jgi:pimeloyl-ACP methyl ester carboxylesterase
MVVKTWLPAGLCLLLTACLSIPPTKTPMPVLAIPYQAGKVQDSVVVFLPGLGDKPQDFVDNGFVTVLRQVHKSDVIIADAHIGYYNSGTILERLNQDVFEPIRRQGYKHVWLVGISLGGGGALLSGRQWPAMFETIVFIAPYLGEPALIQEIAEAGGPLKWQTALSRPISEADRLFRAGWAWLQQVITTDSNQHSQIYLAYGNQDRFIRSHNLLAAALPTDHVFRVDGGHDWPTWRRLWTKLLSQRQ